MADVQKSVQSVTVVCDNPKHARGRVAKIITYSRTSDGTWGSGGNFRAKRARRKLQNTGASPDSLLDGAERDGKVFSTKCKLCGRGITQRGDDNLMKLLATLDLAPDTPAEITIRLTQLTRGRI